MDINSFLLEKIPFQKEVGGSGDGGGGGGEGGERFDNRLYLKSTHSS